MVVAIVAVDVGLYVWVGAKVGRVPTSVVVAAIGGDDGGIIIALVRDGVGGGRSTEAGLCSPMLPHFPHDF